MTPVPSVPHSDGCSQHRAPGHGGDNGRMTTELLAELKAEGLITYPPELQGAAKKSFAPPGKAKKEGGRLVYPSFRRPA